MPSSSDSNSPDIGEPTVLATAFREVDAGDGTQRKDQILTGWRWAFCSFAVLLCVLLVALDQLITAALITTISNQLHEFDKVTWITAAFLLPQGCLSQFWGRCTISFGRKWPMLAGVLFFEVGSVVSAAAQSMNMLIGGRSLQGIGASAVMTCSYIIITEISTMDRAPLAYALMSSVWSVASAVGPIIGGIIGAYTSWRWCFYINLICGAIIIPLFIFTYKPMPPQKTLNEKLRSINYIDNLLLIGSTVLVLLATSIGQTESWKSTGVIVCFVLGGTFFIAFIWYNFTQSGEYPCIPKDIAFNLNLFHALMTTTFSFAAFMVMIQFLSVYLQNVLGHNSFHTGLGILPVAITSSVVGILVGIVTKKTGEIKSITIVGCGLFTLSMGLFLLFGTHENLGYLIGFQIITALGSGITSQTPMLAGLLQAPKTPGSEILTTAYLTFGSRLGGALFSEIADAIYNAVLRNGVRSMGSRMQDQSIPVEEVVMQTSLLSRLNSHDRALVVNQILNGVKSAFALALALVAISFIWSFFMSNKKLPTKEQIELNDRLEESEESEKSGESAV